MTAAGVNAWGAPRAPPVHTNYGAVEFVGNNGKDYGFGDKLTKVSVGPNSNSFSTSVSYSSSTFDENNSAMPFGSSYGRGAGHRQGHGLGAGFGGGLGGLGAGLGGGLGGLPGFGDDFTSGFGHSLGGLNGRLGSGLDSLDTGFGRAMKVGASAGASDVLGGILGADGFSGIDQFNEAKEVQQYSDISSHMNHGYSDIGSHVQQGHSDLGNLHVKGYGSFERQAAPRYGGYGRSHGGYGASRGGYGGYDGGYGGSYGASRGGYGGHGGYDGGYGGNRGGYGGSYGGYQQKSYQPERRSPYSSGYAKSGYSGKSPSVSYGGYSGW